MTLRHTVWNVEVTAVYWGHPSLLAVFILQMRNEKCESQSKIFMISESLTGNYVFKESAYIEWGKSCKPFSSPISSNLQQHKEEVLVEFIGVDWTQSTEISCSKLWLLNGNTLLFPLLSLVMFVMHSHYKFNRSTAFQFHLTCRCIFFCRLKPLLATSSWAQQIKSVWILKPAAVCEEC